MIIAFAIGIFVGTILTLAMVGVLSVSSDFNLKEN